MKRILIRYFLPGTFILLLLSSPGIAQETVRAKIGIELASGGSSKRAKTVNRIKPNQNFRIYVIPEKQAHVYIVHTDYKVVTLLNHSKVRKGSRLILPSDNYFQFDGSSEKESLTIICSQEEIPELQRLNAPDLSHSKWIKLEEMLLGKSKIDLAGRSDKPINIAGSVRKLFPDKDEKERPSWSAGDIPLYSGNPYLLKRYRFKVIR